MKEVTGEGVKSNPEEIKSIFEDLYSSNVEVEYRKGICVMNRGFLRDLREGLLLTRVRAIVLGYMSIHISLMIEKMASLA